jgi:hypothetical protein
MSRLMTGFELSWRIRTGERKAKLLIEQKRFSDCTCNGAG